MKTNPEIKSSESAAASFVRTPRSPRFSIRALCLLLFMTAGCLTSHAAAWSRGRLVIEMSDDESNARAQNALQTQGFKSTNPNNGDFWVGYKDNHTAFITMNDFPPNRVIVNIIVISEGEQNGAVPGALREALERLMQQPAMQQQGMANVINLAGNWDDNGEKIISVQQRGNQIFGTYQGGSWSGTVNGNEVNITNNLGGMYKGTVMDNGGRIELNPNGGGTAMNHTLRRTR